jgi:LPXTG-motif cell wall-anchored protein
MSYPQVALRLLIRHNVEAIPDFGSYGRARLVRKGTNSMKLSVGNLRIVFAVTVIALAAESTAHRANADEWNKKTLLTVNQTIQVKDTVLEPGQYVLRLLNSDSDRHIVQIFNGDQSHLIDTIMAIPAQRMTLTGDSQFTFWETPPGTAKAMRAWYYPGDNIGQEFSYPEHLHLLALAVSPAPPPAPSAAVTEAHEEPSTTAQPAAAEPATEMPAPSAPTEEAPAPAAAAQADETPNPPPQASAEPAPAQPTELPQTGSPYPLLGISGGVLLALGALIRLRRLA